MNNLLPGTELDIRIQEGMPVPPRGGIRAALETGEMVSADIPKEIYGWPFKSTSIPIRDGEGAISGVFTIGISLSNQENVK